SRGPFVCRAILRFQSAHNIRQEALPDHIDILSFQGIQRSRPPKSPRHSALDARIWYMAIRTTRTGTKGTQRDQLVLTGTPEDMRDTIAHAASQASFESWIREVESNAKAILAGSPAPTSTDYDNQTPAYYAQYILRRISLVRAAIRRNDPAEAAFYSVL